MKRIDEKFGDQNPFENYLEDLKQRGIVSKENKTQSTEHQHLALETAKMLGDMDSKAIYFRIFKQHRANKHKLIKCRDWVLSLNKCENKGRVFVKTYKKFLMPYGHFDTITA